MTSDLSSIQLTKKTRDQLSALGHHRESYEDIILRLIESYNNKSETHIEVDNKVADKFIAKVSKEVGENLTPRKRAKK